MSPWTSSCWYLLMSSRHSVRGERERRLVWKCGWTIFVLQSSSDDGVYQTHDQKLVVSIPHTHSRHFISCRVLYSYRAQKLTGHFEKQKTTRHRHFTLPGSSLLPLIYWPTITTYLLPILLCPPLLFSNQLYLLHADVLTDALIHNYFIMIPILHFAL